MNCKINIPSKVKNIMNYLEELNFEVFAVGGCVRDSLLGKIPNDWDMCTNASPIDVINTLKDKYTVIPTGLKHGTVSVIADNNVYEITTYRKEEGYSDSRHPDSVLFVSDLAEDLKRRDFTINAMAYNDTCGLVDLFNGICDLKNKIIRCVGNPKDRFLEDALRMLRGIRFSARLGFSIEGDTEGAIIQLKDKLKLVSEERILEELKAILMCEKPYSIFCRYKAVIDVILLKNTAVEEIEFMDRLPADINLRLASLLAQFGSDEASEILRRLKSDTKIRKNVTALIENKDIAIPDNKIMVKHYLNKFGEDMFRKIVIFSSAFQNVDGAMQSLSLADEVIQNNECYSLPQLEITGKELLDRGYTGRDIKNKLDEILNSVIEGEIRNEKNDLLSHL